MDFDALNRVLARPQAPPAGGTRGDPPADLAAIREARAERSAIMEFDGGLTREKAEDAAALLHPDPTR